MGSESKTTNNALIEHLNKLVQLHADGILTDEDFKALKAKLITKSQIPREHNHSTDHLILDAQSTNQKSDATSYEQNPSFDNVLKRYPALGWSIGAIITAIVIASIFVWKQSAETNSPLKCSVGTLFWSMVIECHVLSNSANITEIILNRGNCKATVFDEKKRYIFGESFLIGLGSCNLVEYSIEVNGQLWTWQTE